MAVLKFGAIVTEGSGSLGGHTIQNSKGGMQLRTKPIPRGNPSASQTLIRSLNQQMQAGWHALTSSQQKIWNDWPAVHGIMNAKGDNHPLSGHSLWMKLQFSQLIDGYPFLINPAYFNQGPELFSNWSNSNTWPFETFITNSNNLNSAINTTDFGIGGFLCNIPISIGDRFILKCNYHLITGSSYTLRLVSNYGAVPVSDIFPPIEGTSSYVFTINTPKPFFYFQVSLTVPGSLFTKNVSLKKIL